jgi:sugar lactone lactonase YvrE
MNCFACMLGDEDRRTLYLVTAPTSHDVKAKEARHGAIEKVRTTVAGAGRP